MSKKSSSEEPITSKELRAKIKEDPFYTARWAGDEERIERMQRALEEYRKAAAPIFEELAQAGYPLDQLSDLYRKKVYANKVTYQRAVPILLRWLPRIDDLNVREEIVRTLSVKWAKPAAAPVLIKEFQKVDDPVGLYKWAIGNALSVVADDSVFDDIVKLVKDKQHGRAREMVAVALGNMKDPRAVDVLIELLEDDEVAGHALIALGKQKDDRARQYIEPFLEHPKAWVRKEAKRALAKIDKAR
jgi:HEAT repeat protein